MKLKPPAISAKSIVILSHLRWIAALIVVLSHVEQEILNKAGYSPHKAITGGSYFGKQIFNAHGYGHAAVVVFFVLSGFLVGGKLQELAVSKNFERDWKRFLADRFVRIFIVLWPALLLTAAVCAMLVWLVPGAPFVNSGDWTFDLSSPMIDDLSPVRWLGAATLFNELLVPTLDTNGPLWSLAYEWFYYIVALSAVLLYRRRGNAVIIFYGAVLLFIGVFNHPDVPTSGVVWVAGWLARIAFDKGIFNSRATFAAGIVAVLSVLLLDSRHPTSDPVLGIAIAFMISHSIWARWTWGASWGDKLAGFSYSLYAIHFPILLLIMGVLYDLGRLPSRLPFNAKGFAICAVALALLLAAARLFAFVTEDRTREAKKLISQSWLGKRLGLV